MIESLQPETVQQLTFRQRVVVLIAAFLGWMFAGLEIALFVLIHRPAMISLTLDDPSGGSSMHSMVIDEQLVKQWFAWYQAAFLFGAAAGGWIFGLIGDRRGRTFALALSVLCYSIFTGACYFASTPFELLVLRFLACLGIGGAWPNTVALVAEAWPDASRPFLAGLLGTAANVGQVLMGVIGLSFDVTASSWRWVLLVGASPVVIGIWCLRGVPESARWLSTRVRPKPNAAGPLQELFRPPLRSRLFLGILLGAIPVIGTAANAQWIIPWTDQVAAEQTANAHKQDTANVSAPAKIIKADPKSKARTQISRSSGAVFGSLLGGILATLLGRRLTYFLVSLLSLIASTIIFGWMNPLHPWFQTASFVFGLVGVIYFGWLPLYLPELFPTRVRATGAGISFNSGRIIAACVVLGTGLLLGLVHGDYARIGLWTGMIYAVGMLIILFAPRTDDAGLKE
jgi:SHS family sialic acid transporter-like MFS transporter